MECGDRIERPMDAVRRWGDTVLLLPFAWIGLVGAWITAGVLSISFQAQDLLVRCALLGVTPLVSGAFGWLLGSARFAVPGRVAVFLFGTPFAGALNGAVLGLVLGPLDHTHATELVLYGAAFGGVCGLCFVPALSPGFVAHLRVGRARRRSFVDKADRRAVAVLTAGVSSLFLWAFSAKVGLGVETGLIAGAGIVVGLVGLLEDGVEYLRVRGAAATSGLVPAGARLLDGTPARIVDFGLGAMAADLVIPARDAYRDGPRRAAVVLGDASLARKSLAFALVRDMVVVGASLLFALLLTPG